jgi:hypothetical protein
MLRWLLVFRLWQRQPLELQKRELALAESVVVLEPLFFRVATAKVFVVSEFSPP